MTTQSIYYQYQTPGNLQTHMLRVAALAEILTENWIGEIIDKQAIVQTCLLHDIAKPMSFDLNKQAQFGMSENDIALLAALQERLRDDYSSNEHEAVVKICTEIGCSSKTIELVDDLEWYNIQKFLSENKIESMIPIYCDMRIGPHGIMLLTDRMHELKTRDHDAQNMDELMIAGEQLEKALQKLIGIDLNTITNDQIEQRIDELRQLDISS